MKQDVCRTVRSLIRLAVEAENIEEARNAALQACKLIHAHALLVHEPVTGMRSRAPQLYEDDPAVRASSGGGLNDLFDDMFGNARATQRGPFSARPPPKPVPPPPQPTVSKKTRRPPDTDAKNIPILESAWCGVCGQRILRGRFATWSRGSVFHPTCYGNEVGQ
jgi:hypothetical protein